MLVLVLAWAQSDTSTSEVELNDALIRSVEKNLTTPSASAKLDIYDQLVFGKGRFLRIDGKSRKNAVLMLDGETKTLVRVFDLPVLDTNVISSGVEYHFGGVLSNFERTNQGIEVTVTYGNLSEVPGRFYSKSARDFVHRTEEMRRRNEAILAKASPEPAAAAPTEPPKSATAPSSNRPAQAEPAPTGLSPSPPPAPEPEQPSSPKTTSESPKPQDETADEKDVEQPAPRNRPVLLRRVESDRTPPEAEPAGTAPTPASGQSPADDDVVIYRRRESSKASSDRPKPGIRTASDRPVLRRKPAGTEDEVDGMRLIPAGYVTLGSDDPADKEKPLHRVQVKSFYLDKTEVTNEAYKQFCDATGHAVPPYWKDKNYPKELEKHPVVQVSWLDAVDYARWAGKRLPTEAEWERAAKGPNSYRYAYGNAYDPQKANTNLQKTSPVNSYPANEFAVFDMTGNVSEWTSSLNLPYPYRDSDGREDAKTVGSRVLKGGSHSSNEQAARCLVRESERPENGSPLIGFRCARDAN
jgi:formylglycine-generating enzyme required for sulfatase activity